MLDKAEAEKLAEMKLDELALSTGIEMLLAREQTISLDRGWLFFYNSAEFLKTGDPSSALAGNGPILVSHDGLTHILPSAIPWDIALQRLYAGSDAEQTDK